MNKWKGEKFKTNFKKKMLFACEHVLMCMYLWYRQSSQNIANNLQENSSVPVVNIVLNFFRTILCRQHGLNMLQKSTKQGNYGKMFCNILD